MEPLFKTIHDALTGETWQEELTAEEYAVLLASGWTEEGTSDLAP
jgi:hypothetical protein